MNPATGSPVTAPRRSGRPAAAASTRTSVSGAILSAGDRPLPSTRLTCVVMPSRRNSVTSAAAAPANVAGRPSAMATCRARSSAITLLDSVSICSTIAVSGGELTLASTGADAGAAACAGVPVTVMPYRMSSAGERGGGQARRVVGPRAVVDRVVVVFERAVRGQPPLVGLERGDRRHVSQGDVALAPTGCQVRPAEQRDVIIQPHGAAPLGSERAGGARRELSEGGWAGVIGGRVLMHGERRVTAAGEHDGAARLAHGRGEPGAWTERRERGHRCHQLGGGGRGGGRVRVVGVEHAAGCRVGHLDAQPGPGHGGRQLRAEHGREAAARWAARPPAPRPPRPGSALVWR